MLFLSLLSQQMKLKLILLSTVGVIIVEDVVVIIEEEVHLEAEEVVIMAGPAERRRKVVICHLIQTKFCDGCKKPEHLQDECTVRCSYC